MSVSETYEHMQHSRDDLHYLDYPDDTIILVRGASCMHAFTQLLVFLYALLICTHALVIDGFC